VAVAVPASAPAVAARLDLLAVRDFRNIARADLAFPPEGMVLVGENGQGKTNLIEAIAYFRLLRSARGARDRDLVRFGAPAFHLAMAGTGTRAAQATAAVDRTGRKKVTLDGVETTRVTEALDTLPSVGFAPRDVDLVAGAPAERRRFLDITLALTSAPYLHALRHYRAALARRNAAMRAAARHRHPDLDAVAAWEPALAEHGAVLVVHRRAWVRDHAEAFARHAAAIGERGTATLRYDSALAEEGDPRAALRAQFERQRGHDVRRLLTHAGPHRDDLALAIDGHDLRTVGSSGQQRTAAIVLRLLEARTHAEATGVTPMLLLDDPFAELDRRRTARILDLLEALGAGQCVLCVPREDEIPARYTRLPRWRVRDGAIEPGEAA
jgi:DNA replication and repair protein RecF